MSIIRQLIVLAMAAQLLAPAALAAHNEGDEAYRRGLEAFRAQQYETALAEFLRARDTHGEDANLLFNLGLTHYRLEHYDQARTLFQSLLDNTAHAPLAIYQLGMIAARTGDTDSAQQYFRDAERQARDPALRTLARAAQLRLGPDRKPTPLFVYLHGGVGHDSNPALLNESLSPLRETDGRHFFHLQALAQWPLTARHGSHLQAGLYLHDYIGHDNLDQSGLHLRWHHRFESGRWRHGLGLGAEVDSLDGRFLQALMHLEGSANRRAGAHDWWLRSQISGIHAGSGFEALEGWRLRTGVNWGWFPDRLGNRHRLGLDLSLELNDRRDLHILERFFSQSPRRAQVRLEWRHPVPMGGELDWTLRWRHSHYPDDDRVVIVGVDAHDMRRRDNMWSAGLLARWPLTRRVSALIDYRYDRNRSQSTLFDYQRHMLTLGLEWTP